MTLFQQALCLSAFVTAVSWIVLL